MVIVYFLPNNAIIQRLDNKYCPCGSLFKVRGTLIRGRHLIEIRTRHSDYIRHDNMMAGR